MSISYCVCGLCVLSICVGDLSRCPQVRPMNLSWSLSHLHSPQSGLGLCVRSSIHSFIQEVPCSVPGTIGLTKGQQVRPLPWEPGGNQPRGCSCPTGHTLAGKAHWAAGRHSLPQTLCPTSPLLFLQKSARISGSPVCFHPASDAGRQP